MKLLIALVGLLTVGSAVLALGGGMAHEGTAAAGLFVPSCLASVILAPTFLLLAARQSRKDKEAREEKLWQKYHGQ